MTMSSSLTTPTENGQLADRRACARETLNWLALVFFDRDNWGKLINLSETGMAFEFSLPPATRQLSTFVLEAMSPQPSQPGGALRTGSIQTDGQIIWTQDSEKTAGVRFADDSGHTRQQIRQWLSLELLPSSPKPANGSTSIALEPEPQVEPESQANPPLQPEPGLPPAPQPEAELPSEPVLEADSPEIVPAPIDDPSDAPRLEHPPLEASFPPLSACSQFPRKVAEHKPDPRSVEPVDVLASVDLAWLRTESPDDSHARDSGCQPQEEPVEHSGEAAALPGLAAVGSAIPHHSRALHDPSHQPRRTPAPHAFEPPRPRPAKVSAAALPKRPAQGAPARLNPRLVRVALLSFAGGIAALAVFAALNLAWGRRHQLASLFAGVQKTFFSKPAPSAPAPLAAPTAPVRPFQVEVLDANNKRWLLTFDHASVPAKSAAAPAPPAASAAPKNPLQDLRNVSAKPPLLPSINLAAPTLPHAVRTAHAQDATPPAVAAAIPAHAGVSSVDLLVGILPSAPQPAPVAPQPPPTMRVGGQIVRPRLISSVPPEYPSLARARRLTGDVLVDVLIDDAGKASDMKVLSGPFLLRDAATDALRQWRYEPARLDGQPTPIHVQVTLKFRAP